MAKAIETVNIKADMPSADGAWKHLHATLQGARVRGVRFLKVVHGYGSSGVGGAIRRKVRSGARKLVGAGGLKGVVFGEDWGPFSADARAWGDVEPGLRADPDYGRGNEGITLLRL